MRVSRMLHKKKFEHQRVVLVVLLVGGWCFGNLRAREALSEPMEVDGAPSGMVTFFTGGQCPPGWTHAAALEGRVIVGTVLNEDVGIDVGLPFTDQETRVHTHKYTGKVVLPAKGIATTPGLNGAAAATGTYSVAGTTMAESTGLPFFQMEGCIKP
jgi:hypothetical protein